MEEPRTPEVATEAPEAGLRQDLESTVDTGHSVSLSLDTILDTFTYDQKLYESPRRRRERGGAALPGFVPEGRLGNTDLWQDRSPGLRVQPRFFAFLGVALLVGFLCYKGVSALTSRSTPAVDQIVGQEMPAKLGVIQQPAPVERLEVTPQPSLRPSALRVEPAGARPLPVKPSPVTRAVRTRPSPPVRAAQSKPPVLRVVRPAVVLPAASNPSFRRYHVWRGDTLKTVSRRFYLTERTIKQVNRLPRNLRALTSGGLLYLPRVSGLMHPVQPREDLGDLAIRYRVPLRRLYANNPQLKRKQLRPGQRVFVPGATRLRFRPIVKKASPALKPRSVAARRQRSLSYIISDRMIWPAGGDFTSGYGARWGSFHSGVDIANSYGTPIRAALDGVVISASWEGGYGYAIDIRHYNGLVTRYAHCQQMYVGAGTHVGRGQVIAAMGATGNTTGPHVHFEVHVNGQAVNPRGYL